MNFGPINSFGINAASSGGANATLTGGLVSVMAMSALLIGGAMLSGGVFTEGDSGGQVSTLVSGGAYSDSKVGGKQFYTANLSGFIDSEGIVGSSLGIASGLNGGCYSPSGFGGELLCNTRLQVADTVGDTSFTDGGLIYSAGLSDGIFSNSWLSSNIVGSTVLITSGVFSDSVIDSGLQRGFAMEGGVVSNQVVGGTYLYGAILSDGIPAYHSLGESLQVGAVLQDGIIHVGEVGSPSMRISTEMDGGFSSHTDFTAQILISVHGNSGVFSNQTLVGYLRKDEKLLGGVQSSSFSDSQGMLAAQRLQGGVVSAGYVAGTQAIGAYLSEGTATTSDTGGQLRTHAKLQGNGVSISELGGQIVGDIRLHDGVYSEGYAGSPVILISQKLSGSLESTSQLEGFRVIGSHMVSGTEGTGQINGNLITHIRLQGGTIMDGSIGGIYFIEAILQDGITSDSSVYAATTISPMLLGGMSQECFIDGRRLATPFLTSGVVSDVIVGGDVVQGFKDPLLNTWALSIASVTPILSIETPLQDI